MHKDKELAKVFHYDLQGKRDFKYDFLNENSLATIEWNNLEPNEPNYFIVKKNFDESGDYEKGFKVDEMFAINNVGIATGKDSELINFNKNILENKYELKATNYSYRPFDIRFTIFDRKLLQRARFEVMKHMNHSNLSLQITSKNRQLSLGYIFIAKFISDRHLLDSAADSMSVFPLYLYPETNTQQALHQNNERTPNLNTEIVNQIATKLGLTFTTEKILLHAQEDIVSFAPIDILDYIYAVLHSPAYREKYKEFLKIDFPKVPYPKDVKTFWELVALGAEIRQIHLLESPIVENYITQYPINGDNVVGKISFALQDYDSLPKDGEEQYYTSVYINDTQFFGNVPLEAWEFYIGGYQPAQKWLKDRKGRKLEFEDILHYQKIIVALTETHRIMQEINLISIE